MADPPFSPKPSAPFFVISLAGHNSVPIIPDAFLATHFEGKNELTKLKLTTDACDRTWEVNLKGRRFAVGWEDFSASHSLRDDDVLIFRHDGEMIFHVTPSGRTFSQILCISSSSDDSEDDKDNDDDDEDDEDDDEDDDETWDKVSDYINISSKRKSRLEAESSSSENSCLLGVTSSNQRLNQVCLARTITIPNGLHKSWCEIDIMNQSGKSWVLYLRHNKVTGQDYMRGGWTSFCRENKLKTGSFYRFKIFRNGKRPALQLCSDNPPQGYCSKANRKAKVSEKSNREGESSSANHSKFMTVTLKPYMSISRQVRLRSSFARENGIKKGEKITLVDRNGGAWPSCVASSNGGFYVTKGWIRFCEASGITTGETFTLKFDRGEDKTSMLQFCSKAEAKKAQAPFNAPRGTGKTSWDEEEEEAQEETGTRFQKKARISAEGEASRRTQASHKSTVDPKSLQCTRPLHIISDQVRQSIVDVLADVRRFRSELEIKEQTLEAVLQQIDVLGEKVLELNKILK